jgi:predicted nucleic acid-binding protein
VKQSVYLETTIPSYLVARRSSDAIVAGHQACTREWWDNRRKHFRIFISQAVIDEAGVGNPELARKRLELLKPFIFLEVTEEVTALAIELIRTLRLPRHVAQDAVHIAASAVNELDFLLTWNCRHIANAQLMPRIELACTANGYRCPRICTPYELMGDISHER